MKKASIFNGPHFVASFDFKRSEYAGSDTFEFFDEKEDLVAFVSAGHTIIIEEKKSFWESFKSFFK